MTDRAREVIELLKEHGMHPSSCFGPKRRGNVYPVIFGGVVTESERAQIIAAFHVRAPVVADGAQQARWRIMSAHDDAVKRHT